MNYIQIEEIRKRGGEEKMKQEKKGKGEKRRKTKWLFTKVRAYGASMPPMRLATAPIPRLKFL